MNITCERPYVFFALLLIIPVFIILRIKNRKTNYSLGASFGDYKKNVSVKRLFSFRKLVYIRSFFIALAWCMLVLAYAKIYWGTYLMPVQKNGTAVSFVFDISNSMMAKDMPDGNTRLKASSDYAEKLLSKMDGISASVVLAKGDGVVAIPLTEDKVMIESLLEVMSPSLMTVPGTSLGKGILKAKESFPSNYGAAGRIWVFTDGEETDGHLKSALVDCVKGGIPVSIVGFGGATETGILAGDGKTVVKSALRSEKILKTIDEVQKSLSYYKNQVPVTYIDAMEKGSAYKLLNQLKTGENQIVTYEAKPVPRYKLFLLLSVLFFSFSYIFTEVDFSRWFRESKSTAAMIVFILMLSGCSSETSQILKGTYAVKQKQLRHAVSCFFKAGESAKASKNQEAIEYALYDLGTTYAMLGESDAAMEKFLLIDDDAPKNVRYAKYYNAGVLAHKEGKYDEALEFFRKSLEIDSSRIEAKINMELSIQLAEESVQHNESKSIPASENKTSIPDMEKSVFERIKENDKKQWKNSESNQTQNLANDY